MDKPISLSVKDYLIRKMAVKMMLSEKTIESVINHQFQSANEALAHNKSLELSGFGKLLFNENKAKKRMEKYLSQQELFTRMLNDPNSTEQKKQRAQLQIEIATRQMELLKPKLDNEYRSDLRGMEEQADSPKSPEGCDRTDISGEN